MTPVIHRPHLERVVAGPAELHPSGVGDGHDVLGPVPGKPVVPDHRFEDQDHARAHDQRRVEGLAEVGADEGHLGTVGPDPVGQVEVLQPRPDPVVGGDGRPPELQGGHARLEMSRAASTTARHRWKWLAWRSVGEGWALVSQVRPKSEA